MAPFLDAQAIRKALEIEVSDFDCRFLLDQSRLIELLHLQDSFGLHLVYLIDLHQLLPSWLVFWGPTTW